MSERNRPTSEPGGVECTHCGCIFIGAPWHCLCGICAGDEHIASEDCWCGPEVDYIDPETGAKVFVHKRVQ